MKRSSSSADFLITTMNKFSCAQVEKTFPDIVGKIRAAANSSDTKNKESIIETIKGFEKKFYQDEIRLLLCRIEKMDTKNKQYKTEIQTLMKQVEKLKMDRKKSSQQNNSAPKIPAMQQTSKIPTQLASRLKLHQAKQINKMRDDYEKALKQKDKAREEEIKEIRFEHHCKVVQLGIEKENIRKQKQVVEQQLETIKKQLNEMKSSEKPFENSIIVAKIQGYKDQNALLRSFVSRTQDHDKKIKELEAERTKQRKQFSEYAIELQQEKRKIYYDMDLMIQNYEQKIKLIQLDILQKMRLKDEKIVELEQQKQMLSIQSNLRESGMMSKNQFSMRDSTLKYDEKTKKKQVESQINNKRSLTKYQKLEKSLGKNSDVKQRKSQFFLQEIEQLKFREMKYLRQIEKMRIERNQVAVQNYELQQKVKLIWSEMSSRKRYSPYKDNESKSKLFDIEMKEIVSKVTSDKILFTEESTDMFEELKVIESRQYIQGLRLRQIEEELTKQRQNSRKIQQNLESIQDFYKGRENSMRLKQQMSENSYKELWEKHEFVRSQWSDYKNKNSHLELEIRQLEIKLNEKQYEIAILNLQNSKQNQRLSIQCESLKQKYRAMKDQYDMEIEEMNLRCEQLLKQIQKSEQQAQFWKQNHSEVINNNENLTASKNFEISSFRNIIFEKDQQKQQLRSLGQKLKTSFENQILDLHKRILFLEEHNLLIKSNFDEVLKQKQQLISKLLEELQLKPLVIQQRKRNNQVKLTLFDNSEGIYNSIIGHEETKQPLSKSHKPKYQFISQINAVHESEVKHLKSYISDLTYENKKLTQNYEKTKYRWKEMFPGVKEYNDLVIQMQQNVKNSTIKKIKKQEEVEHNFFLNREIEENTTIQHEKKQSPNLHDSVIEEKLKQKNQLGKEQQALQKQQQIFDIPNFSQENIQNYTIREEQSLSNIDMQYIFESKMQEMTEIQEPLFIFRQKQQSILYDEDSLSSIRFLFAQNQKQGNNQVESSEKKVQKLTQ